MEKDNSTYNIPSAFIRPAPTLAVAVAPEISDTHKELADIAEEIQECRKKILRNY